VCCEGGVCVHSDPRSEEEGTDGEDDAVGVSVCMHAYVCMHACMCMCVCVWMCVLYVCVCDMGVCVAYSVYVLMPA